MNLLKIGIASERFVIAFRLEEKREGILSVPLLLGHSLSQVRVESEIRLNTMLPDVHFEGLIVAVFCIILRI